MVGKGISSGICCTRNFMENFNEDSDEKYFLEPDFWYHKKLHELHNDLIFLSERIKIKKV